MRTILYGVAGEGNGHYARSKIVIDELKKTSKVELFSHGQGYKNLKKHFPVNRILGFHMYYINNTVSSALTGLINTLKSPFMLFASLKYIPAFLKHKPDLVITDFEPFILYWSKLFNVPCISIDNQHIITNTSIDKINRQFINEFYSKAVIHLFLPNPAQTLITTFFNSEIKCKNTKLLPPLIKPSIIKLKPKKKQHIFVYQTSKSYKRMFPVLKKINKEFIIYGFNKEAKDKNLTFKKFNNDQYLEDLAVADAVIINGGFTLLTESLYLQKPIFSIPIKRQFEQIVNGHYINKLNYGVAVRDITVENFNDFLKNKEKYRKNIKKIKWDNNNEFFDELDKLLHSQSLK